MLFLCASLNTEYHKNPPFHLLFGSYVKRVIRLRRRLGRVTFFSSIGPVCDPVLHCCGVIALMPHNYTSEIPQNITTACQIKANSSKQLYLFRPTILGFMDALGPDLAKFSVEWPLVQVKMAA